MPSFPLSAVRAYVIQMCCAIITSTPAGEGYPSSLSGLRSLTQAGLPVLVVGAAEGRDVIPEAGNYK
jgi:hypothetical protein